ncbi:MAG: glycosyltransferase family 2 protein [Flavobacterium sp.]
MKPNNPLVSIIIPTYNRAHLISETLDSVLSQTYPHWECIVVDDGSTDGTLEIIHHYQLKNSNFKILHNQRAKGAPGARNTGLLHATGVYCMFLDSDDVLLPFCLMQRVAFMQQNSNVDFAVFQCELCDENLNNPKSKVFNTFISELTDIERFLTSDYPWTTCSTIIKKSNKEQLLWNEQLIFHQDVYYYLQLIINEFHYKKSFLVPDCKKRNHFKGVGSSLVVKSYWVGKLIFIEQGIKLFSILNNSSYRWYWNGQILLVFLKSVKWNFYMTNQFGQCFKLALKNKTPVYFTLDVLYFILVKRFNGAFSKRVLSYLFYKINHRKKYYAPYKIQLNRFTINDHLNASETNIKS